VNDRGMLARLTTHGAVFVYDGILHGHAELRTTIPHRPARRSLV
jgi:hypothetical protein